MSRRTRSAIDAAGIKQAGINLLESSKEYSQYLNIGRDSASFNRELDGDTIDDIEEEAKGYLQWAQLNKKYAPEEADKLKALGLNLKSAVDNERELIRRAEPKVKPLSQTLKEIKAAASGPRDSGKREVPVSTKVKKGGPKVPKVKKVKVPKVPKIRKRAILSEENQRIADRNRERRQGFKQRRLVRMDMLETRAYPREMRNLMDQYIRDYITSHKDGDSAVARVVRDKTTGQFKRLPRGETVYKRGGIVRR